MWWWLGWCLFEKKETQQRKIYSTKPAPFTACRYFSNKAIVKVMQFNQFNKVGLLSVSIFFTTKTFILFWSDTALSTPSYFSTRLRRVS